MRSDPLSSIKDTWIAQKFTLGYNTFVQFGDGSMAIYWAGNARRALERARGMTGYRIGQAFIVTDYVVNFIYEPQPEPTSSYRQWAKEAERLIFEIHEDTYTRFMIDASNQIAYYIRQEQDWKSEPDKAMYKMAVEQLERWQAAFDLAYHGLNRLMAGEQVGTFWPPEGLYVAIHQPEVRYGPPVSM